MCRAAQGGRAYGVRVAVLRNPTHPVAETFLRETQAAGQALGVRFQFFEARDHPSAGGGAGQDGTGRCRKHFWSPPIPSWLPS